MQLRRHGSWSEEKTAPDLLGPSAARTTTAQTRWFLFVASSFAVSYVYSHVADARLLDSGSLRVLFRSSALCLIEKNKNFKKKKIFDSDTNDEPMMMVDLGAGTRIYRRSIPFASKRFPVAFPLLFLGKRQSYHNSTTG